MSNTALKGLAVQQGYRLKKKKMVLIQPENCYKRQVYFAMARSVTKELKGAACGQGWG